MGRYDRFFCSFANGATFCIIFVFYCTETRERRRRGAMTQGKIDLPTLLATDLNGYFGQLVLDYQQRQYPFRVCR